MAMRIQEGTYVVNPCHILSWDSRKDNGELPVIDIGKYCSISLNCTFMMAHHNYKWVSISMASKNRWVHGKGNPHGFSRGDITIGHDVWIGANCTILDNLTIGNGAVIATGSIVTKNVEPYTIVGGNPAKFIKYRFSQEQIKKLLEIQWWNFDRAVLEDELCIFSDDIDGFIEKCSKYIKDSH